MAAWRGEGGAVDDVDRHFGIKMDESLATCGQLPFEIGDRIRRLGRQQRIGEIKRIGEPYAAVAKGTNVAVEQALGGRVVQVDVVFVGENELYQPKSVAPPRFLAHAIGEGARGVTAKVH